MNLNFTDGQQNIFIGRLTPSSGTGITNSTVMGRGSFSSVTSGSLNTAIGISIAPQLTGIGDNNTIVGAVAFTQLAGTGGEDNTLIGTRAGQQLQNGESNNIFIGSNVQGQAGDENTIKIGIRTAGTAVNRTFIGGIRGQTTGVADAIAVLIDSAGQLGTVSSSKRFKENITNMPADFSNNLLDLQPTLFNYKTDASKTQTWGLIAEDVQEIFPQLVVHDKEGLPMTVKYHDLPVLLLNEIIKLKKEVEQLKQQVQK
jgi:hypothetical protein